MKKILLSAIVVLGFTLYAVYVDMNKMPVLPSSSKSRIKPKVKVIPTVTSQISNKSVTPGITGAGTYKDGVYKGTVANAVYGNLQVEVTITGNKIYGVKFLQFPNDQYTSSQINIYADPLLAQEAIQAQSANVDVVSSATLTSKAFVESLQSALTQAE
jgi:uncharacterized protein with FMN-binding domain